MTTHDPNVCWDPPENDDRGGEGELELPLELFFAEDRGDPVACHAERALESDVLSRVGSERGFVSARERSVIRRWRGTVLALGFCLVLAAAVADRLGVAPWTGGGVGAERGPVSMLMESTSAETAVAVERARQMRDRLVRVVEPSSGGLSATVEVTLRRADGESAGVTVAEAPRGSMSFAASGPYLTANGFGVVGAYPERRPATVIRFEDGFAVPAMVCDSPAELRWPASREIAASMVSVDGDPVRRESVMLAPLWYAPHRLDSSR
ncbi:MAG: hypothetical protein AAGJ54_11115 [Planctomycetota bacterium]